MRRNDERDLKTGIKTKTGGTLARAARKFVCEVVRPANREQVECGFLVWRRRGVCLLVPGLLDLLK